MKEQITAWLQSGGTYAAGLELFDALARPVDIDRCQTYLHGGTDGVRRAMLEGELRRILHGLRNEPQLYGVEPTATTSNTQHPTPNTAEGIGIHIAKYADLPADMQAKYDRLKQIAPLIGSLHADLTRTDINGDKRKLTAQELCQLDDERRKLWQQLDAWAEGQTKEEKPAPTAQQPTSTTEVSAEEELQLWRRDKRLRDNVRAARQTIETQEGKEGCEGTVARAKERLARYTKEQVEVRARLAEIKQRRKKQ